LAIKNKKMAVDVKTLKAYQSMPTIKSIDTDWIKWVDFVMAQYGTNLGKQIFINTWTKRGSRNANTRPIRQHLKDKYNIEIDESVWDKIVDVGGGISDGFGTFMKVGKITTIVVVGLVGVTLIGIAYSLIKNPSNALLATPQGRALKLKGGLRK